MHDYYPFRDKLDSLMNDIQNLNLELFDIRYEKKVLIKKEEYILRCIELAQAKINEILPDKK